MQLFLGIIGIVVIVYVWIWIINNAFKNKNFKWHLTINIFVLSLFLVALLFFYKDILVFFKLDHLYLLENSSWKNIASFIFYCFAFILLLTGAFGNFKKKLSFSFLIASLLLFVGFGIGGAVMGINVLFMYYLVSSYAEEILKFSIGQNIFLEKKDVDTHVDMSTKDVNNGRISSVDLLFFAIIAGLGFSVIENIFYLVARYFSDGGGVAMSVGRSIFATLLHVSASGLIAFFIVKNNKFTYYILGILAGFALHLAYNLSIFYKIQILTIVVLLICYFILSYLLFQSDLVYQKK